MAWTLQALEPHSAANFIPPLDLFAFTTPIHPVRSPMFAFSSQRNYKILLNIKDEVQC